MPRDRAKKKAEEPPDCPGGRSFSCDRSAHKPGAAVYCWRCNEALGCARCVQLASELVCLRCHDWGSRAALRAHGPMVRDREVGGEAFKIALMIQRGQVTQGDGEKLIAELCAKFNQRSKGDGESRGAQSETL